MAKSISQIEKDGFTYNQHDVAVDGGKTKIGVVDVLAPTSLEQISDAIENGLETEAHVCSLYSSALAVELQRQARTAKAGGKMSQLEFATIYNALDIEDKKQPWAEVQKQVAGIWRSKQDTTSTQDSEDSEDA